MNFNVLLETITQINMPTSPKNPPNNLKAIKALYDLTDKELAGRLNIEPSYLSSVANGRATFSGSITIKLLKELNITFSFLYNVNDTVETPCEVTDDIVIIFSTSYKIDGIPDIHRVIPKILEKYDDPDTKITVNHFSELKKTSTGFRLNVKENDALNNTTSPMQVKFYATELKKFDKPISDDLYYYLLGARMTSFKSIPLKIDTYNSLVKKDTNFLNNIPFKKLVSKGIPKEQYKVENGIVILDTPCKILTENGVEELAVLREGQYKSLLNGDIMVYIISDEDTLNKFKIYRTIKGYSQEDMASKLGLTKESYRLLEVGHNKLTTHQMWKIENHLGILLESIINIDSYYKKINSTKSTSIL